jgi:crotonobetainyl-CoA:carnitine CoA-transferase CaiB-like acyl-CoA transferase
MTTDQQRGTATAGALDGLRVLVLRHGVAGPLAARLLADFGADVIKVERPGAGDFARYLEPIQPGAPAPEQSLVFQYLNWNKRGLTLDLRTAQARPILRRLIERSDIVIEAFRPGTLDRWDLGVDQLLDWNPNLVVTSVTNFGQTGPYRDYEASDLVFQAMSGIMQISGRADREPIKHGLRQSLYCAGLNAAYATMAASIAVAAEGGGEHVDLSIHECLASEMVMNLPYYAFAGAIQGRRAVVQDPFGGEPLPAGKGYLSVQTGGGAPFQTYAEFFGRDEFTEARFATPGERLKHVEELRTLLQECLADKDAHEVFVRGAELRLLMGVVQGARDLLACEHLAARGFLVEVDHPDTGPHTFPGELAKLSATPFTVRRRSPRLGEHNRDVLRGEAGLSDAEIETLEAAGVV